MKYHINPETGEPGRCRARKRCPFGDLEKDHYVDADTARKAYEASQDPFSAIDRRENPYDWPPLRETEHRKFSTPRGTVHLSIASGHYNERSDRTLEAWLETSDGNVSFVKLIFHDEAHYPSVGPYLAMCDIETRPDARGKGYAKELREALEEHTGLLIYSSGSYTPEGWEAFGAHGRYLPNPYASSWDKPGINYRSMGFVASWKHRVPINMDSNMDYTDAQREATWELSEKGVFQKFRDKEILWAED